MLGMGIANIFGLDPRAGLLVGSVSLVGGIGTTLAWVPDFVERLGIHNALEIGTAGSMLGLIIACIIGGPIASYLMREHKLTPSHDTRLDIGLVEMLGDEGTDLEEHQPADMPLLVAHDPRRLEMLDVDLGAGIAHRHGIQRSEQNVGVVHMHGLTELVGNRPGPGDPEFLERHEGLRRVGRGGFPGHAPSIVAFHFNFKRSRRADPAGAGS